MWMSDCQADSSQPSRAAFFSTVTRRFHVFLTGITTLEGKADGDEDENPRGNGKSAARRIKILVGLRKGLALISAAAS
jgi:hypothetical protein